MLRKFLYVALLAAAATLTTSAKAQAWGAYHVGYTHIGPYGVEHYGRTVGVGPYGVYSGARYGTYGMYSGYRAGYAGATTYRYGYSPYGTYARYGGYYRGW